MLAKLFFLIALVLFIIMALGSGADPSLGWWGFAAVAAGLLVEGYGPARPLP